MDEISTLPVDLPATASDTPPLEGTEPPAPFVNLIDPKLKERALKRIRGIIKGNGIKAEMAKLATCDALIYPFRARTFIKLLPKYGVRTEPGLNRKAELIATADEFNAALQNSVTEARTDPVKRKQVVDHLMARPDKGFGMKDQTLTFHVLKRDFVMHEGCVTCSKLGKVQCQKCHATGMLTCATCQGRKQINCPQCRGSGKTPGSSQSHSCSKCHGDGKIQCTTCAGRGQNKCSSCAASGTLKCQKCAGSGWLSHLAHMEMEARIHFDFDRQVLPVEVQKMVDAFGARLVEKGDVEVVLHQPGQTAEEIKREIQLQNEPDDSIFLDYDAKVPFGPVQFKLRDRAVPATLFGYHGKLIEAPSFLDDLVRKGSQALAEAASGMGDVGDKIRRAAKYRILCDIILLAAGKTRQRKAIEILSHRYPTGIAADKILNLFISADKALKAITHKPRIYGLITGSLIFSALAGGFTMLGRSILLAGGYASETILTALDIALLPAGVLLIMMTAQGFAVMAQRKALMGLTTPDTVRAIMPKAGKSIWWSVAIAFVIWATAIAASAFGVNLGSAPVWAQQIFAVKPL